MAAGLKVDTTERVVQDITMIFHTYLDKDGIMKDVNKFFNSPVVSFFPFDFTIKMFYDDCLSIFSDYLSSADKKKLMKVDEKINQYFQQVCCWKYIDDECLDKISPLTVRIISERLKNEDLLRISTLCPLLREI